MRISFMRPALTAASIVAAAGVLAGGLALRPASAVGGSENVGPFGVVKCASSSPCQTYKNHVGAGLQGINTSKTFGVGLSGTAATFGTGVAGSAGTSGNGVTGSAGNVGVSGTGGTWGVFGYSNCSFCMGVEGQSVNGDGVVAYSSNANGMTTASGAGNGLFAIAGSSGVAVYGVGGTGDAIVGAAGWGGGVVGLRATNDGDNGSDGNGADMEGSYIGVVARNKAGGGFPLVAADTNGTDLMYVDSAGNLFYHGSLIQFARTRNGNVSKTFSPTSAAPTIEDNGTAQLVGGEVTVQLDSAFAHSIDLRKAYQVMLTPDGDTKGLFIASKSPTAFVVREVQGGHGTLAFDYHIYAPTLGQATQRMSEMSQAQAAASMPRAPMTFHAQKHAKIRVMH
jgi:hypothetical protein